MILTFPIKKYIIKSQYYILGNDSTDKLERNKKMNYQEIVKTVQDLCKGADISDYNKHLAVEVQITGEGEGVFYIEARDGKVYVEPYDYHDRDVRLITSADNFIKIANGELDPVKAFFTGKLKIDGSVDKALEFKNIVDKVNKSTEK